MKYCQFSALKVTEVFFSITMKHDARLYFDFSSFTT